MSFVTFKVAVIVPYPWNSLAGESIQRIQIEVDIITTVITFYKQKYINETCELLDVLFS